jgi:hypothetical protein
MTDRNRNGYTLNDWIKVAQFGRLEPLPETLCVAHWRLGQDPTNFSGSMFVAPRSTPPFALEEPDTTPAAFFPFAIVQAEEDDDRPTLVDFRDCRESRINKVG